MSISEQVLKTVSHMKKGEPFPIDRLYKLGSSTAIQKALSRMVKEGKLTRVAKGIYVRPKPLKLVPNKMSKTSPKKIAEVWAKNNGRKLVPQAQDSAYRLGLQTQAPIQTILWSNGPTREFQVGNSVVKVKHVPDGKLRWAGKPEGELLRGMTAVPASQVKTEQLKNALVRLKLNNVKALETLTKIKRSALLSKEWINKIEELTSEIRI